MELGHYGRYECRHCHALWDDDDRNSAVRAGKWRDRETGLELFAHLEKYEPAKIAFQIPAWLSYFVKLSECAAAFLKGLKSKAKLKDFQNGYAAEPWVLYEQPRQEDSVLALRDARPRCLAPARRGRAGLGAPDDRRVPRPGDPAVDGHRGPAQPRLGRLGLQPGRGLRHRPALLAQARPRRAARKAPARQAGAMVTVWQFQISNL